MVDEPASVPEISAAGQEEVAPEIRILEVFAYEFRVSRRERTPEDPEGPTAHVSEPGLQLADDGLFFTVVIPAKATFPFADSAILEIEASAYGNFGVSRPVDIEFARLFATTSGVRILWPYVRSTVGEIGRMVGLPVPPLPLILTQAPDDGVESRTAADSQEPERQPAEDREVSKRHGHGSLATRRSRRT